jgi:hypothetical protein
MHARRILLEHLPDQRLAVHASIRRQQRLRIQVAQLGRRVSGCTSGSKMKIAAPDSPARQQALAISHRHLRIRRIFGVRPFEPLLGVSLPNASVSSASCKNDCDAIPCSPSSADNSATRRWFCCDGSRLTMRRKTRNASSFRPCRCNLPAHSRRFRSPASCWNARAAAQSGLSVPRSDWCIAPASCR